MEVVEYLRISGVPVLMLPMACMSVIHRLRDVFMRCLSNIMYGMKYILRMFPIGRFMLFSWRRSPVRVLIASRLSCRTVLISYSLICIFFGLFESILLFLMPCVPGIVEILSSIMYTTLLRCVLRRICYVMI